MRITVNWAAQAVKSSITQLLSIPAHFTYPAIILTNPHNATIPSSSCTQLLLIPNSYCDPNRSQTETIFTDIFDRGETSADAFGSWSCYLEPSPGADREAVGGNASSGAGWPVDGIARPDEEWLAWLDPTGEESRYVDLYQTFKAPRYCHTIHPYCYVTMSKRLPFVCPMVTSPKRDSI